MRGRGDAQLLAHDPVDGDEAAHERRRADDVLEDLAREAQPAVVRVDGCIEGERRRKTPSASDRQ